MTEKHPTDTDGRVRFDRFLRENDISMVSAGKALGVSNVTVFHWRTGEKRPVDHQRTKIRIWTGIPESTWRTPEENEEIERVQPFSNTGAAA
jgi:hypothetical protein